MWVWSTVNLIGDVNLTGINFTFDALCSVKPDPYDPQVIKREVWRGCNDDVIPYSWTRHWYVQIYQVVKKPFQYQ